METGIGGSSVAGFGGFGVVVVVRVGTHYVENHFQRMCFNADSVPAEAVMLICPPCYTVKNVRSGRGDNT